MPKSSLKEARCHLYYAAYFNVQALQEASDEIRGQWADGIVRQVGSRAVNRDKQKSDPPAPEPESLPVSVPHALPHLLERVEPMYLGA